ncbi:porin [Variovorax sp.]|uniref:porin n=1 Tax=Variovorax sp. TaxID=1871043 RepID=UPI003BAD669E
MKKRILAASALLGSGFACAQSTVQLYGMVDLFVQHLGSGGRSLTQLADGGNGASRFGFRGAEDLGGGLAANFVLEAGVNSDTGAGTLPGPSISFTRQAFVGLSGGWGRVDAGRMYTPMFNAFLRADPFGMNAIYSPLVLAAQTDAQPGLGPAPAFRASNMVRYRTPQGQAFMLDLAYSFGEASTASKRSGEFQGGAIGYDKAPYYLAYSFSRTRTGTDTAPVAAPVATRVDALSARIDLGQAWALSAHAIRVGGGLPSTPAARLIDVGVSFQDGLSRWTGAVVQRKVGGSPRGQFGVTLGYDYALSKRTVLYGRLLHLSNRGGATASAGGIAFTPRAGDAVRSSGIGIRHSF